VVDVRLTVFWDRMNQQFGETYAESVAKDYVMAELGGRTIDQALGEGESAKRVWQAVCATFDVPQRLR
jgi:predicted metalloprotease